MLTRLSRAALPDSYGNRWGYSRIQHQLGYCFRPSPRCFELRILDCCGACVRLLFSIIGETGSLRMLAISDWLQWSDFRYMARVYKPALIASELLKQLSYFFRRYSGCG